MDLQLLAMTVPLNSYVKRECWTFTVCQEKVPWKKQKTCISHNWDVFLPFPMITPILESSRRSARPQLRVTSLKTGRKGRTSHSRRVSSSSSSCTAAWLTHSNMWLSISPRNEDRGNDLACFHKSLMGSEEKCHLTYVITLKSLYDVSQRRFNTWS